MSGCKSRYDSEEKRPPDASPSPSVGLQCAPAMPLIELLPPVRGEFRALQAALEKCSLLGTSMKKPLCPCCAYVGNAQLLWMAGVM